MEYFIRNSIFSLLLTGKYIRKKQKKSVEVKQPLMFALPGKMPGHLNICYFLQLLEMMKKCPLYQK